MRLISQYRRTLLGIRRWSNNARAHSAMALGLIAILSYPGTGVAETFPNKPVQIVVPFGPGGPADSMARIVGEQLSARLGNSVVIVNKPGASGSIGADAVAKAAPDGYTLLLTQIGDSIAVSLNKKLPYNYEKDFVPVTLIGQTPFIVVVHPGVKANTVRDLINLAKAQPKTLTFGSAGTGLASHLAVELFNDAAGIDVLHVPYKGQMQATTDLLGGQISYMFNNPVTSLPHVKTGRLRALAVTGPNRLPSAPEIPTVAESGIPGFDVTAWFGIMAPAGTNQKVIAKLNEEMRVIVRAPAVKEKLRAQGIEPVGNTPSEFQKVIKNDIDRWTKLIESKNIQVD